MSTTPVPVPAVVYEGLEVVRLTGGTNMLDRPRVIELAEMLGYHESADWVRNNPGCYAQAIFAGLAPEDPTEGAG